MKKKTRRLHLRSETLRTLNGEVQQAAGGAIAADTRPAELNPGGISIIRDTFLCTNDPTAMTWCYICPVFEPEF